MKNPLKNMSHFLRLMASDDHGMPSSSRVIGTIIFATLCLAVASIYAVLLFRTATINDSTSLGIVVNALIRFDWVVLILAATALSLYGINVWKYVAQIRAGGFLTDQLQRMYGPGSSNFQTYYPSGMGGMNGNGSFGSPFSNMAPFGSNIPGTNVFGPTNIVSTAVSHPLGRMADIGSGGSKGSLSIKTLPGKPAEPCSEAALPRMHTTEAGVGSDE